MSQLLAAGCAQPNTHNLVQRLPVLAHHDLLPVDFLLGYCGEVASSAFDGPEQAIRLGLAAVISELVHHVAAQVRSGLLVNECRLVLHAECQ